MFAYMHLCKERSNTQYIHIYIHANPGSFFFFYFGEGGSDCYGEDNELMIIA